MKLVCHKIQYVVSDGRGVSRHVWDFGAVGGVALFGLDPGFLMFYGALLVVCTFGRFGLGASGFILPSI